MYYSSPADSLMLKRSALGPARIAARNVHLASGRANNDAVSTFLRTGGSLGALGDAAAKQVETTVIGAGAKIGATAAASSLLPATMAGAWAGPVGMAAGAVIGLIAGNLLNKKYLDVGGMNNAEDAEVAAFNQYKQLGGTVPGRAIGLSSMTMVWKGALHSGYFPKNNQKQCFHKGCSKYPGNASWIDTAINGGSKDRNCFPDVLPSWKGNRARAAQATPVAPVARNNMRISVPRAGFGLSGLGDLAVPDAVDFIDNYFIPANAARGNGWAVPTSATEHQVLYDVADAYLAQQAGGSSNVYIANPSTMQASNGGGLVPSATSGAYAPAPSIPATGNTYAQYAPLPNGPAGAFGPGGSVYTAIPVTNPATGQTTYAVPSASAGAPMVYPGTGIPVATPAQPIAAGFSTAGLSDLPVWGYLLAGAAIIFALAKPGMNPPKRRRAR